MQRPLSTFTAIKTSWAGCPPPPPCFPAACLRSERIGVVVKFIPLKVTEYGKVDVLERMTGVISSSSLLTFAAACHAVSAASRSIGEAVCQRAVADWVS
eukprot:SAG11_NODE_3229_length_2596_cov_1.746496_4_plen_99_part_00